MRSQDIEAVATRVPGVRYVDSVLIAGLGTDGTVVASMDPVPITGLQLPAATVFVNSGAAENPVLADRRQPARPAHPGTRPRRPRGLLITMDVQGSQFHLIHGLDDWGRCTRRSHRATARDARGRGQADSPSSAARTSLEYDETLGALRLRHDLPLFRRAGRTVPLDPAARRGAGRDAYGNWYWIDDDQVSIRWRPVPMTTPRRHGGRRSQLGASCADADASAFAPCLPPPPTGLILAGLAVTTHHYLAAGYVAADEQGLLLFDLQAGGAPLRLLWPSPFAPFDLADTPDGGLLVLDRSNAAYFQLDEHFRLRGQVATTEGPSGRPPAGRRRASPARPSPRPTPCTPGPRSAPSTRSASSPGRRPGRS